MWAGPPDRRAKESPPLLHAHAEAGRPAAHSRAHPKGWRAQRLNYKGAGAAGRHISPGWPRTSYRSWLDSLSPSWSGSAMRSGIRSSSSSGSIACRFTHRPAPMPASFQVRETHRDRHLYTQTMRYECLPHLNCQQPSLTIITLVKGYLVLWPAHTSNTCPAANINSQERPQQCEQSGASPVFLCLAPCPLPSHPRFAILDSRRRGLNGQGGRQRHLLRRLKLVSICRTIPCPCIPGPLLFGLRSGYAEGPWRHAPLPIAQDKKSSKTSADRPSDSCARHRLTGCLCLRPIHEAPPGAGPS